MIRVLVADDHPVVRKGLSLILSDADGIEVAAEAASAAEVLQALGPRHGIDVVVLDVSMPGRSGLELLEDLRRDYPKLPVLMLSQFPEEQIGVRAIRAGAAGYLNKESAPEQLVDAVRRVYLGRKFVTPIVAELLATSIESGPQPPHETLSSREYDVFLMLARGKSPTAIASEMNLSVKTISTYRRRVLEKMQFASNADLTRYALKTGLTE